MSEIHTSLDFRHSLYCVISKKLFYVFQDEMTSEESLKLDNWQCGYSKSILMLPKPVKANRRVISRLIFKFFDFFATFDYKTLVISPFLGRAVTKEVFGKSYELTSRRKITSCK